MTMKATRQPTGRSSAGPDTRARSSSTRPAAPAVVQLRAGAGSIEDVLLLQRLAGNQAVTREVLQLPDVVAFGACEDGPLLECSAKASRTSSKSLSIGPPAKKKDKEGNVTYNGKGSLTAQFASTVKISLATVPSGLSKCATGKYKALIKTKLSPHEQDHKKRFLTTDPQHSYNGLVQKTIKESGDDASSVMSSIKTQLNDAFDTELSDRQTRNDAYAIDAIDPFHVTADISDCPECKAPEESE